MAKGWPLSFGYTTLAKRTCKALSFQSTFDTLLLASNFPSFFVVIFKVLTFGGMLNGGMLNEYFSFLYFFLLFSFPNTGTSLSILWSWSQRKTTIKSRSSMSITTPPPSSQYGFWMCGTFAWWGREIPPAFKNMPEPQQWYGNWAGGATRQRCVAPPASSLCSRLFVVFFGVYFTLLICPSFALFLH